MYRWGGDYQRDLAQSRAELRMLATIIRWVVIGVLMAQVISLGNRMGDLEVEYRQHIEALDRACAERRIDCDGDG